MASALKDRERAKSTMASTAPRKPPWNDIPPRQTAKISDGSGEIGVEIVEQHVADAAAEDDAERHPDDQIVDVGRARLPEAGPVFGRRGEAPGKPPAADEAGDIGERVPADRQRADGDGDRVDRRKRQRQEGWTHAGWV